MPIEAFKSIYEFEEFKTMINRMVEQNDIVEVFVEEKYSIIDVYERWFKCSCGSIWRFVYPDFPFKGMFIKVEKNKL